MLEKQLDHTPLGTQPRALGTDTTSNQIQQRSTQSKNTKTKH